MSKVAFEEVFLHCDQVLAELVGEEAWRAKPTRWFRPASGFWSEHMLSFSKSKGYKTVLGNCFPFDTSPISRHTNAMYLTYRVRSGAVVIVHDRWHTANTLRKALPTILKNVRLETLSSLESAASS